MNVFRYVSNLSKSGFHNFEELERAESAHLLNILSLTGLCFSLFCTVWFQWIDWVQQLQLLTVSCGVVMVIVLMLIKKGHYQVAKNLYLFYFQLGVVVLIWFFSSQELPHMLLLISFGQAFLLFSSSEKRWRQLHLLLSLALLLLAELEYLPERTDQRLAEVQATYVREFFVISSILMNSWLLFVFSTGKQKVGREIHQINQKLEEQSKQLDANVKARTRELQEKELELQQLLNESNEQNEQLIQKEMELIKMIDELESTKVRLKNSLQENELAREKVNILLEESQLSNKILQVQEDILKANLKMQQEANVNLREAQLEQQKFVATVEHSTDLIALFDFEGNFFYLNGAGQRMLGLDAQPGHDRKLHISDLVDDENYMKLIAEVEPKVKRQASWRGEVCIRQPQTGASRTMDTAFFSVFDASGKIPLCRAAIMRDITISKALSEEHKLLSMVASKTTNVVIITDAEGRAQWVNEAFTSITGYQPAEVLGKKPGSVLQGPETDPKTVAHVGWKLRHKESVTVEILNYHKNGHSYWLEMSISPVLDSYDNVVNFIAIESDITRRKKAEIELQEANKKLLRYTDELQQNNEELKVTQERMLLTQRRLKEREREQQKFVALAENSFDLLLLADMDNFLIFQNQACKKRFGFSPRKKDIFEFLKNYTENGSEVDNMKNTAKVGGVWKGQLKITAPVSGKEAIVDALFFLVKDNKDEKRPICQALLMHDITELKGIEENLWKANTELEQNSDKLRRTNLRLSKSKKRLEKALVNEWESKKELQQVIDKLKSTQTQLIQSEKMASLGQLTAGIAHEINNPVNFVYAGSEALSYNLQQLMEILNAYVAMDGEMADFEQFALVQKLKEQFYFEELKSDIFGLIDDIRIGAERTAEIVKGLRNFSRLDEHDKKLADVNQCLDSTLILLRNQFKDRIELVKNYGDIPPLHCYPGQINQVFMNILSNAIQAISGEGRIELTTQAKGGFLEVRIQDNGSGIPEEIKDKIFDPFFTTKEVGDGTGLGLSISYGIIKKHEGEISLESKPGEGTCFTIKLPILG